MKRGRGKSKFIFLNLIIIIIKSFFNENVIFLCYRSANSVDASDLSEASVANITISNESLAKSGESIVVSGKGMGSTVKVKMTFLQD